jgi:hypothetical protein
MALLGAISFFAWKSGISHRVIGYRTLIGYQVFIGKN